jgi:HK97 family phage portal protein
MSLFARLLGREEKAADFSALTFAQLFGSFTSKAGVGVSISSALGVSTVFACCRVLAEGIAQLPLKLFREKKDGSKELALDHPAYFLLSRRPNDWQTSFEWRETMMFHAILCQGGFTFISRDSRGRVLELLPLVPQNVRVVQDADRVVSYKVTDSRGLIADLPRENVIHLRGPSWDGTRGLEVITLARDAIGLSIAQEETLAKLHGNGTRPSGILSTDGKLQPDQIQRIKASWAETYAGSHNAFKTVVLDAGMKFSQMSLSPADTQSNEGRMAQIQEVCRFLRVFPQMIGYADKTATYASAEQFFLAHVIHSLGPWIERWEQALERDVLTRDEVEKGGLYVKLLTAGFLRGDSAGRSTLYKEAILNGWMTRNEVRHLEDLDPLDGLDEPLTPLNMGGGPPAPAVDNPKLDGPPAAAAPPPPKAKAQAAARRAALLEEKVGRVLSAANEGKLRDARDMVDEVLQQVDPEGTVADG